jgi:hypothetical protein
MFTMLARIAQEHGYCLALHGSMIRDLDVVAVPWVSKCSPVGVLVDSLCSALGGFMDDGVPLGGADQRAHGRLTYRLRLNAGLYVDLSVVPPQAKGAPVTLPAARRISIDFDGVIHSYTSGWLGATEIPDPPVEGMADAIRRLQSLGWEVVCCSSRARYTEGKDAICQWLLSNGFPGMEITCEKLPAEIYVDDRAIRFDGCVPELLNAIDTWNGPWNRGGQIVPAPPQ